jgi:hypothetical protein
MDETNQPVKAPLNMEKPPVSKTNADLSPKKADPSALPPIDNNKAERKFDWSMFLEAVKQKKRTLGALVQEGKPLEINDRELILGFPPNLKYHLENLPLPQNKTLLETIYKDLFGADIKILCIPIPVESKTAGDTETPKAGQELLNKAVQLFGGEVQPLSKEERSK